MTTRKLGTTTIFILGTDPSTKEQEVRHPVATEIKVSESDIQIRALKKDKFGDQTVIAEVPRDQAAPLIKSRKIQIGWTDCGVRERMDIDRCFRCLEYGHKTRSCTAEIDRSNDCIKCGEKGHKGKECTNRDRCIKCNVNGHRADQFKCPHFKKLVEELRRQKIRPAAKPRTRSTNANLHGS